MGPSTPRQSFLEKNGQTEEEFLAKHPDIVDIDDNGFTVKCQNQNCDGCETISFSRLLKSIAINEAVDTVIDVFHEGLIEIEVTQTTKRSCGRKSSSVDITFVFDWSSVLSHPPIFLEPQEGHFFCVGRVLWLAQTPFRRKLLFPPYQGDTTTWRITHSFYFNTLRLRSSLIREVPELAKGMGLR